MPVVARAKPPASRRNADTWLTLEQTAVRNWPEMGYRKTYDFGGEWIDDDHRRLAEAPEGEHGFLDLGITGWLLRPDALKLYELAYFADDVMELGTCCGLSASIISRAMVNSGRRSAFATVDLDAEVQNGARWHLDRQAVPGREGIRYFAMDGAQFVRERLLQPAPSALDPLRRLLNRGAAEPALPKQFSFAFIDHSHTYAAVAAVCPMLKDVIAPGGFVLFHDYNDPRNSRADDPDYGVYQAVADTLPRERFDFYGVFGCTGLFRLRP